MTDTFKDSVGRISIASYGMTMIDYPQISEGALASEQMESLFVGWRLPNPTYRADLTILF